MNLRSQRQTIFLVFLFLLFTSKGVGQCFNIESILVDSCDSGGDEGYNEMVRFKVGSSALNTSAMVVNYPANNFYGIVQNAISASKVATLNTQIAAMGACGRLIEPPGGVLPANAEVILVTSYNFSIALNIFGALTQNVYIIFDDNNTAMGMGGHFGNFGSGLRTLSISFGACSDSVTYDRSLLVDASGIPSASSGATVNYTPAGVATYSNLGCVAPVEVFSVDAGSTPVNACPGATISLSGAAQGQTSLGWTAIGGAFSNSSSLTTNYTLPLSASGVITVTLTATNACGNSITDAVTINVNAAVTPAFTAIPPVCSGTTLSALPTTSLNGITGSWSPALDNLNTTTYTFAPTAGQCAVSVPLTITINLPVVPVFNPVAGICSGQPLAALATTSTNGITGIWSPALDNTNTTTYTFTPAAGQCAITNTLMISVNAASTIPTFNPVAAICTGGTLSPLPTTSLNGITGTWSPALDNTATTTYTFTPNAGQCATTTTLMITVNVPTTIATFNPIGPACAGTLTALPTTATNGITGTWSPALDNTNTKTYTFTPNASQCALGTTMTITVTPTVTPVFAAINPGCVGEFVISPLLTISTNGISGIWSPAFDNTTTKNYTFTPNSGQCATNASTTVAINALTTPTFNLPASICRGDALVLPATSSNGITGTWSPAVNNTATTNYTFTPNAGQCAGPIATTVAVVPKVTPTFNPVAAICQGASLVPLPTTSTNGITGSWSPALDNMATKTYTFTPSTGQCANTQSMMITVNPAIVPIFSSIMPICTGDVLSPLLTTSTNGITGTWSPALDNTAATTYLFMPSFGQCATTTNLSIAVNSKVTPDFPTALSICSGGIAPTLATVSPNGFSGSWSPAIIDNLLPDAYVFTPNAGQCANTTTLNVTITTNPVLQQSLSICFNAAGQLISPATIATGLSDTDYTFSWTFEGNLISDTTSFLQASQVGTYEVVAINILTSCSITTLATVAASPSATASAYVNQDFADLQQIIVDVVGGTGPFEFQLNNGAFQTSNVFTIIRGGDYVVHVKDATGCNNFELHVTALNFPKFFTPNDDYYNDTWNIDGLSVAQDGRISIFDRYGKLIKQISANGTGWDGTSNGKAMPSTDYWFVISYLDNGKSKSFRSHFSLKR